MKFRCVMLTALGVLLTMPVLPAKAASGFTVQELPDGTAAVACSDPSVVEAVVPETIDGKQVTALAENCFDGCTALESVTLPEGITEIGSYAFQGCTMLETVEIPAAVTKIGDFVFEGCHALTAITVEDGNESYVDADGVLYSKDQTLLIRYPAAKESTGYSIPQQCRSIAPWGFTDCVNLRKVDASSVTVMGADCFMGCWSLQTVTLSDDMEELIGAAFARCEALKEFEIPAKVTSIGDRCFYGCAALEHIKLPAGLESVGEMAFYGCTGIDAMTVPARVHSIGDRGIGYSISSEGKDVLIPGFSLNVPLGSYAASYAKDNGIPYHTTLSRETGIFILIGLFLVILLIAGSVVSVRSSRAKQREEEARVAEEERQKRLAAYRAKKQKKKKKQD